MQFRGEKALGLCDGLVIHQTADQRIASFPQKRHGLLPDLTPVQRVRVVRTYAPTFSQEQMSGCRG